MEDCHFCLILSFKISDLPDLVFQGIDFKKSNMIIILIVDFSV